MDLKIRLVHVVVASLALLPLGAAAQVVDAGDDVILECASENGTEYTLNGTAPTGVGIVNAWSTDPVVALTNAETLTPTGVFPLGVTTVTLSSTPDAGAPTSDDATVTVQDTLPPVVRARANPGYLWPPNHSMHSIGTLIEVSDLCGDEDSFEVTLIDAKSSEPDNGLGDGNTKNDIQGADIGTDDRTIMLRAERAGGGSGRIYTLTYLVTDGSGNETEAEVNVRVPHDFSDIEDEIGDGGDDDDDSDDIDAICRRPASAVDELTQVFPGLGSASNDQICNEICRVWAKSCDKIAAGSGQCVQGEGKAFAVIAFTECKDSDDRPEIQSCVDDVKAHLAEQNAELRQETDDARNRCANMGQRCANACSDMFD